ncbi:adenosine receptor A1-like [Limulus polyphemus]|uniref:Adenosine receptor A1-like n=1 Tax=Limulus polyphemus TaxID=6850 RepID=A0ABM1T195_LIMPO|nr:adenosine receptor A1-like [Limulus polyphemus]
MVSNSSLPTSNISSTCDGCTLTLEWKTSVIMGVEIMWTLLTIVINILTVLVILFHRRLRTVTSQLVVSLCVANLLFGVSMAYHAAYFSVPEHIDSCKYCCLLRYVLILLPAYATAYNLAAISLDRYLAIFYPLHYTQLTNPRIIKSVVLFVWFLSTILALLLLVWNKWAPDQKCDYLAVAPKEYILCFMVIPAFMIFAFLAFVHTRIWFEVRRLLHHTIAIIHKSYSLQKEIKTAVTVIAIVISYCVSFLPYHMVLLVILSGKDSEKLHQLYTALVPLTFLNPCVNPLIYVWRNRHFRKALFSILGYGASSRHQLTLRPMYTAKILTPEVSTS